MAFLMENITCDSLKEISTNAPILCFPLFLIKFSFQCFVGL